MKTQYVGVIFTNDIQAGKLLKKVKDYEEAYGICESTSAK